MFATGFVIVQSDPVVSRLREEAQAILRSPPAAPLDLTPTRYMIATVLEDAVDVSHKDRETARMILNQAVDQMLRHAFTKAGRYTPRMKDLLADLQVLDPELGRLARRYHRAWSFRRQLGIANRLADRIVGARGFFEWQSDPEAVEKQSGQNNSEPT